MPARLPQLGLLCAASRRRSSRHTSVPGRSTKRHYGDEDHAGDVPCSRESRCINEWERGDDAHGVHIVGSRDFALGGKCPSATQRCRVHAAVTTEMVLSGVLPAATFMWSHVYRLRFLMLAAIRCSAKLPARAAISAARVDSTKVRAARCRRFRRCCRIPDRRIHSPPALTTPAVCSGPLEHRESKRDCADRPDDKLI